MRLCMTTEITTSVDPWIWWLYQGHNKIKKNIHITSRKTQITWNEMYQVWLRHCFHALQAFPSVCTHTKQRQAIVNINRWFIYIGQQAAHLMTGYAVNVYLFLYGGRSHKPGSGVVCFSVAFSPPVPSSTHCSLCPCTLCPPRTHGILALSS